MGMSVGALAANKEINQDQEGGNTDTIEVNLTLEESWTVTIPNDVKLSEEGTGEAHLKATVKKLEKNHELTVNVAGKAEENFQLTCNGETIAYTIKSDNGVSGSDAEVQKDEAVLTVGTDAADGQEIDAKLSFEAQSFEEANAGTYSDTLTFTVSCDAAE